MIRNLFAISIICCLMLVAPYAVAQQPGAQASVADSNPPNQTVARVQEMFSLVETKSPDAQIKIKQALKDESWYVRGEAARALGRLGDNSAAPLLLALTQDPSWFVRDSALEALAAIKASSWSGAEQMMTSPDSYTRARAAATLGAFNYAPSIDLLINALSDSDEF